MLKLSLMYRNFCWNLQDKQQTTNAKTRPRILGLMHFSLARNLSQKKKIHEKKSGNHKGCFLLSKLEGF